MTDPSRPQPVISAGNVAGLISTTVVAVSGLVLVVRDGITADNLTSVGTAVNAVVVALVAVVAYLLPVLQAHRAAVQVTPLASPMAADGKPLVPVDSYGKHAAAMVEPVSDMAIPDAPLVPDPVRPQPFPRTDAEPSPYYSRLRANAPKEDDAPVSTPRPLGRLVRHDPRSLQYLVEPAGAAKTAFWQRRTPILDQGNLGSCTGNATVGVLGTEPFYDTLAPSDQQSLNETEAVKVYSIATQLDGFTGTYPPDDTGSSGLGAAQAAKKLGLINGYLHITSVAAAQTAIQAGPFIVGSDWYSGMDNPDANGVVKATGSVRGGHEYECYGYDAVADLWHFWNSWGPDWGNHGGFAYSSTDFAKLLANSGDATTFVPITQPAPVPTPVPVPTPTPAPTGFPLAAYEAWKLHTRSIPKTVAMEAAIDAWLNGG